MAGRKQLAEVKIGPVTVPLKIGPKACSSTGLHGEATTDPNPEIRLASLETHWDYIVMFHECIHLISDFYELNFPEDTFRTLDQAITQLLMDNPRLVSGMLREGN